MNSSATQYYSISRVGDTKPFILYSTEQLPEWGGVGVQFIPQNLQYITDEVVESAAR